MPQIVATLVDVFVFRRAAIGTEFLLLRRHPERYLGGVWQAVSGKIELGEAAWAAALRELCEETQLTPLGFWNIDRVSTFYDAKLDRIHLSPCFAAEVDHGPVPHLNPREHTEYRWAGVDNTLETLIWPQHRDAVREILTEIVTPSAAEPHLRVALPPPRIVDPG